jgi:hypothetical protein
MTVSRAQKKFITIERAKRRLQNRLSDIDWELDVLTPQVEELKALEASHNVEIGVVSEDDDQD